MPIFPGDLPNPEIKLGSPALKADSLLSEPPGKYPMFAIVHFYYMLSNALNWKRGQTKHVLRHFSCVRLFMTVWTVVCQAPLSMGFARRLDEVAISYSRASSQSRGRIRVSCIAGRFFTAEQLGKPQKQHSIVSNLDPCGPDKERSLTCMERLKCLFQLGRIGLKLKCYKCIVCIDQRKTLMESNIGR